MHHFEKRTPFRKIGLTCLAMFYGLALWVFSVMIEPSAPHRIAQLNDTRSYSYVPTYTYIAPSEPTLPIMPQTRTTSCHTEYDGVSRTLVCNTYDH